MTRRQLGAAVGGLVIAGCILGHSTQPMAAAFRLGVRLGEHRARHGEVVRVIGKAQQAPARRRERLPAEE